MRTSEIVAEFKADCNTVWDVVTNNDDFSWRSDLERVEVSKDGKIFTEYSRGGGITQFVITRMDKPRRYEFNMESKLFTGNWIGVFSPTKDGGSRVIFTENIHVKNPIIRLLSSLFWDLKKIQETYISDLKRKLGE